MTNQTDRDNAPGGPDDESSKGAESQHLLPADFGMLVNMLSTQAMLALGLIPHPTSGKQELQPVLARHFIDLLTVIETKTKGNLDREEASLLEESLHHLRMTFIELTRK